jgi:transposase
MIPRDARKAFEFLEIKTATPIGLKPSNISTKDGFAIARSMQKQIDITATNKSNNNSKYTGDFNLHNFNSNVNVYMRELVHPLLFHSEKEKDHIYGCN